ncbi:insoluble domain protein [Rhodococcus sp. APC 3903]|uniref:insoluble domain protein n=1 Tax=Rhodococcus sp. APC 3903 TaxID=3035193 RepID=UPI0025B590C4|nr:insoluble domain protein [Rhodococcus sp. APC 3903]MDN3460533.1 insoluble domain protein [Rhodococcus sp. APC 3903]
MKHHKSRPTGRHRAPSAPVIAAGTLTALVVATFATAGIAVAAPQPGVTGPAPGQPGVTAPSPSPSPAPAPAPAPSTEPVPEPVYWVPPPAEYQNVPSQPLPNWDYDSGTYTAPADYSVAPIDYGNIHAPGPVEIVAPIIAPREKGRIGDWVFDQPNWASDQDLARTNNTSAVIESQVSTFYASIGIPVDRASRIAAAQLAGGAGGALAGAAAVGVPAATVGALIGGTIGGTSALGLFSPVLTPIGAVPAGVVGTATGAGIGAAALGVPAAAIGAVGGGIAGVAAATAYGAGELGEPVDVSEYFPDVDQPAVTTQTQNTLDEWSNSGPIGQAVATTVRDTVSAAPAIDQQARDFVAAQPGGEQIIEQVDTALTDFFTNATPGLASSLISGAVGAGTQA